MLKKFHEWLEKKRLKGEGLIPPNCSFTITDKGMLICSKKSQMPDIVMIGYLVKYLKANCGLRGISYNPKSGWSVLFDQGKEETPQYPSAFQALTKAAQFYEN